MKRSITASSFAPHLRRTLALGVAAALCLSAAAAQGCPTGYLKKGDHCLPGPKPRNQDSHSLSTQFKGSAAANVAPASANQPPRIKPILLERKRTAPSVGPGPVEHAAGGGNQHPVISTGGKNAINSQPVPPKNAAHAPLHPLAPAEKNPGH